MSGQLFGKKLSSFQIIIIGFLTVILAGAYFGSRKILKKGISPILLIGISALAGILVYG